MTRWMFRAVKQRAILFTGREERAQVTPHVTPRITHHLRLAPLSCLSDRQLRSLPTPGVTFKVSRAFFVLRRSTTSVKRLAMRSTNLNHRIKFSVFAHEIEIRAKEG